MKNNLLYVYLNDQLTGILEKDDNGGINFTYNPSAKQSLSLSLPLDKKTYLNNECKGFFNGLLPESEFVRVAIGRKYNINPKNDFSILEAIGYDCAGAVAFLKEENPNLKKEHEIKGKILTESELEKYILELPKKPLALGSDKRLSLAGAQEKTAIIKIEDKIALPDDETPSTHILKPAMPDLKETIENEFICLKSAQKMGIRVPEVEICQANNTKYFLIERYDRIQNNNIIQRVHQEDFCQAKNIVSAYKYQSDGGIDFKQCFEILRKTDRPAVSIKQFIEIMIFNYLIGNNDAHGKNFSILHKENCDIEFAPTYDILCTQAYSELSKKMAMKIGGYYEPEKIYPRHFEKFANDVEISYTQLNKIIKNQCEKLPQIVIEVANSFENTIGLNIIEVVEKNCNRIYKNFKF